MTNLKVHTKRVAVITTLVIVASLMLAPWAQAQSTAGGKHCVAHLDPVSPQSDEISKVTPLGCYDTFEEAIFVATDGTVKLPAGISPYAVTEDLLKAYGMGSVSPASVVIGTDYDDVGFSTLLGTFTWTGSQACSPSMSFTVPSMPQGWNDRVSSARSYSDCNRYYHYENTNYGGTSITCDMGNTCQSMGTMTNKTSSEKFQY